MTQKNMIKRDNKMNSSQYRLKEVTQRVLALAIEQAQDIGIDLILSGTKTIIVADYYAKIYGCSQRMAYEALKTAVDDMYYAEYVWSEKTDKGVNQYRTRFVSHIGYLGGEGAIEFVLTPQAREHIMNLTKNFTLYEIQKLTHLGKYGIRLYELLAQWRSVGHVEYSIEELRTKLGLLPDEYEFLGNFKKRVLDVAVDEINEHTDFKVEYKNVKNIRTVIGFYFTFKVKPKAENENKSDDSDTAKTAIIDTDSLTDTQKQALSEVEAHIAKKSITDVKKIENLKKMALDGRWKNRQNKSQSAPQKPAKTMPELPKPKSTLVEMLKQEIPEKK